MTKTTYSEKLRDPKWQKKRLEVFERDEFKCIYCSDKDSELHVHHKYYEPGKEPWEYPMDCFETVCGYCHELLEGLKKLKHSRNLTFLGVVKYNTNVGSEIRVDVVRHNDAAGAPITICLNEMRGREIKEMVYITASDLFNITDLIKATIKTNG